MTFVDFSFQDVSQGDLINRAKNLKNNGNNLLKDAKNAAKDLKGDTRVNLKLKLNSTKINLHIELDFIWSIIGCLKTVIASLPGATKDLNNQRDRLQDAEQKKKALEKELLTVQDGLRGIQRGKKRALFETTKPNAYTRQLHITWCFW